MHMVFFHNPEEENGYLSNWYMSDFELHGLKYSSMEQYMMYQKAVCFGDNSIAAEVMHTSDVAEIKAFGRMVSNYNDNIWAGKRQIVVYKGLCAKFSQNEELWEKLKGTKDAILAECAVRDRIWGIGLSMNDSERFDMNKWTGKNLLGYALMEVRDNW